MHYKLSLAHYSQALSISLNVLVTKSLDAWSKLLYEIHLMKKKTLGLSPLTVGAPYYSVQPVLIISKIAAGLAHHP